MASPLDLYSFVSGEYDAGRKQRDGNRLKALYQQALSDPSQNQRAIIGQVAGIDLSQAKGLYDLLNSRAEDQRKAVGQRAAMVRALPQEQRQAAYEGIRPDLDAAGLFAPEGADEGYLGAVAQTYGGLGSAGDSAEWRMFNNLTSMGNLTPEERAQAARVKLRLAPGAVGAARKAVTIKLRNGLEVPGEYDPELGYTVWDSSQNAMVPLGRGDISGVRDSGGGFGGMPQPQGGDPFASLLAVAPNLRVTSRDRSPAQNQKVGGVSNSFHLTGQAIDIGTPSPQERATINQWAAQNGYEVIDNYQDGHVHLEPRGSAPRAQAGIQSMIGSQTPAEKAYTEQAAKTQADLDAGRAVTQLEAERTAAKTRAEADAKAQSQRVADLPNVIQTADETIGLLNQAINHPGRSTVTGMSGTFDPRNYVPGTDATDFRVLLDQLGGRAFLQAFESLKGGGQITEVEGRKATEAMARLNTAQSDEAFKAALIELRGIAESAKRRAIQRASGQQQAMGDGSRGPARVQTPADYDALPSGAIYISPDGQQRRKR